MGTDHVRTQRKYFLCHKASHLTRQYISGMTKTASVIDHAERNVSANVGKVHCWQ